MIRTAKPAPFILGVVALVLLGGCASVDFAGLEDADSMVVVTHSSFGLLPTNTLSTDVGPTRVTDSRSIRSVAELIQDSPGHWTPGNQGPYPKPTGGTRITFMKGYTVVAEFEIADREIVYDGKTGWQVKPLDKDDEELLSTVLDVAALRAESGS